MTPPLGARGPAYRGEHYTPTLRLKERERERERKKTSIDNNQEWFGKHNALSGNIEGR
jgi:hypothetical protein